MVPRLHRQDEMASSRAGVVSAIGIATGVKRHDEFAVCLRMAASRCAAGGFGARLNVHHLSCPSTIHGNPYACVIRYAVPLTEVIVPELDSETSIGTVRFSRGNMFPESSYVIRIFNDPRP
jgi:hypothetical protein